MDKKKISKEFYEHLTQKIIPFWTGLRDDECGGYYGYVDYDLGVDRQAVKGCILNSRILWFFSNAYMLFKSPAAAGRASDGENARLAGICMDEAVHAYEFMRTACFDREYGGVFWAVNSDGTPADDIKHTYNQAFAIYALSSYYDASGDESALESACELVDVIESRCTDDIGYLEAFNRDFTPAGNDKLSENGVMADKTMNTLLHVFEAYTELLRVAKKHSVYPERCERIAERLRFMLTLVSTKIYNPVLKRQEVFFDDKYNSIIDLHSYGHDIETSWLLERGLEVLGDSELTEKLDPIIDALAEHILERAYVNHSLLNECERGVDNTHRIWWVQAETVVGFTNAAQRCKRNADKIRSCGGRPSEADALDRKAAEFFDAAMDVWQFIQTKLTDSREGSEWFWELDANLEPIEGRPIVEPWKCPYHNGRMCMEMIRRLGAPALHPNYYKVLASYEEALNRKNSIDGNFYNGIYDRWVNPVLTRDNIPVFWKYDLNPEANPFFEERLGVNATMNSGAIKMNGKYCLVVRVEGNDRKSFFAVAESDNGVDGFRFRDYPILFDDTCPEETNVYDMRLTRHEDGWIYGVFCSESKDNSVNDLSAAVAAAGIVRTKDLEHWERLDNLKTLNSPQQRNVVLHPEFVNGKYAFYTRPMDDFIETGSGGGIGFGLCDDICHAVIDEEIITSKRKYHTITEAKNGAGAVPIKTDRGWIHIAHGVRNTAAGLRYVIYAFATDLNDPSKVIAEPSGLLIGPRGDERVGDVSNVTFTNGAIVDDDGKVFIYYASSDTRMHVATTTLEKLTDYVFNTPSDPLRSVKCVEQRCEMIRKNLEYLGR